VRAPPSKMRELRRPTSGDITSLPRKEIEPPDTPAKGGRNEITHAHPDEATLVQTIPISFGWEHTRATAAELIVTPANKENSDQGPSRS
jgi:hypothetical protein